MAKLPRDTAIVLIAGTDPLKDRKYDISTHPRWHSVYPGHEGALYGRAFDFADYKERRCRRE